MNHSDALAWLGLSESVVALVVSIWSARQSIAIQRVQFQEERKALLRVKDPLSTSDTRDAPKPDWVRITNHNIGKRTALDLEAEVIDSAGVEVDPREPLDLEPGDQADFAVDLRNWFLDRNRRAIILVLMTYRDTERHTFLVEIFAPPRMEVDPPFEFHRPMVLQVLLDGRPSPISHHPEVVQVGNTTHIG